MAVLPQENSPKPAKPIWRGDIVMSNISQRDAFWNNVYKMARRDPNIIILSADMGAPALDQIRRDIPSQFVNVGIAEQNAILVATGLAMTGKRVFTYAIAPFITLRCLEQIRVENAMMNIPITIVGVGAGFGYEDSGPTHHLIEDLTIMRSMPNIIINSITDSVMAAAVAELSCTFSSTNYVRLDRQALPPLYPSSTSFTDGVAIIKPPAELCIVATGNMVHMAKDVSARLATQGLEIGVIDLYTLPINTPLFLHAIRNVKKLVTLEEHYLAGGLGSAVCEVLADNGVLLPVKRLGLPLDKGYCYEYGGRETIRGCYGLDEASIINAISAFAH
jgi:transketolase